MSDSVSLFLDELGKPRAELLADELAAFVSRLIVVAAANVAVVTVISASVRAVPFDKDLGYKLYPVKNNNWVLIYTFEQLPANINRLAEFLEVDEILHTNNAKDRIYGDLYKDVCDKIEFPKEYKQALLDTEIMRYFYSEDKIKSMGL